MTSMRPNDTDDRNFRDERTESDSKGAQKKRKGNKGYRNSNRNRNSNRPDNRPGGSSSRLASGLYANGSPGKNDLSWYTKNPELIAISSRLAFPYRPGNEIKFNGFTFNFSNANTTLGNAHVPVPGTMSLEFIPTVGWSSDTTSPISVCAERMWTQIRSKFSSDLSVDSPDIFMYVYGLGNIHAYLEWLKRVYRTINTYSQDNYDFPRNIMRAQFSHMTDAQFNTLFDELKNRRLELVTAINEMVNAVNVFRIPDQYPILHRMRWMNQHVYMDEPRPNAQTYVFRQMAYYKLDDTGDNGSALIPVSLPTNPGLNDLISFGWNLINAMTGWEDAFTINGYIYRAWEGSPTLIEALISELEVLTPVYVPEVLMQIENANLCPIAPGEGTQVIAGISQDPSTRAIIHMPAGTINYDCEAQMLNMHDDTSDAAVIIATRMSSMAGDLVVDSKYKLISGTEFLHDIRLIYGGAGSTVYDHNVGNGSLHWRTSGATNATDYTTFVQHIYDMLILQYWHHHPTVYAFFTNTSNYAADTEAGKFLDQNGMIALCDIDQATSYSKRWLQELHRVTMYSLFNVFNKDTVIGKSGR